MSDSRNESRKRKFLLNKNLSYQVEAPQQSSTVDLPSTSAALAAPVSDIAGDSCRQETYANQRREYEKFERTVTIKTNCQHNLQNQWELAALQAGSDSSDDEPSPRRLRPNNSSTKEHKTDVSSLSNNNTSLGIDLLQHTEPVFPALVMSSLSDGNKEGVNMDLQGDESDNSENRLEPSDVPEPEGNNSNNGKIPNFADENSPMNESNTEEDPMLGAALPAEVSNEIAIPTSVESPPLNNPSTSFEFPWSHFPEPRDPTYVLHDEHVFERWSSPLDEYNPDDDIIESSSEDEDYYQIIHNIENCYITNQNGRYSHLPHNNAPTAPHFGTGEPRASSWINQRRRFGGSGRGSPQTSLVSPYYGLSHEQVYPETYNYISFGTNEVYFPVSEIHETVFFNHYVTLEIPYDEFLLSWHHPQWDSIPTGSQEEFLPSMSAPRRPSDVARRWGIRSASSENIHLPSTSQGVPDRETNNSQNATQSNAQGVISPQAGSLSNSNSRSIPDLNVIGFCPICTYGLNKKKVVSTYCGHLFCEQCLHRAILINGKQCPTCRQYLEGQGYHPVYF